MNELSALYTEFLGDERYFGSRRRYLQPETPDYTSPPTDEALAATPEAFRSDEVVDLARNASAAGECTVEEGDRCHIPFPPEEGFFDPPSKVGAVIYCGGLVDPRAYSPLAAILRDRYGMPVVIPIFADDIALNFGTCDTNRLALAQAEFPDVEQWVLVGHSLGGVAAVTDVWTLKFNEETAATNEEMADSVGGLVLMGADVQSVGCGTVDFSEIDFPMAILTASEDEILNTTRAEMNNKAYASNATFFMDILGGNHGQFGSYDDSGRFEALGQVDGTSIIPDQVQFDLTTAAIYHVAARTGATLGVKVPTDDSSGGSTPDPEDETRCPPPSAAATTRGTMNTNIFTILILVFLWAKRR